MTPGKIRSLLSRIHKQWGSWASINRFFGFTSESGTQDLIGRGSADGPTLRLLALLKLYGRHAGRLWDARYKKQIKDIIKGEPDEQD